MRTSGGQRGRVRCFIADSGGVVAVEFALVGLLTVELVLESLQGGLYLYQRSEIERVTALAARQVMIGAVAASGFTASQFLQQVVCAALPSSMSCTNVVVDLETVSQATSPGGFYAFANADMSGPTPMPAAGAYCAGSPGNVMYLRISYKSIAISPVWRAVASSSGTTIGGTPAYSVTAYSPFRNEPFTGGSSGC